MALDSALLPLSPSQSVLMLLHVPPIHPYGGTELHARLLLDGLIARGGSALVLFPLLQERHLPQQLGVLVWGQMKQPLVVPMEQALALITELAWHYQALWVEHSAAWPESLLVDIGALPFARKAWICHDHAAVCPSFGLHTSSGGCCEVESDAQRCQNCYSQIKGFNLVSGSNIPLMAHRRQLMQQALDQMDQVLYVGYRQGQAFAKAFPEASFHRRSQLWLNPLKHLGPPAPGQPQRVLNRRVAFVGAGGKLKGARLFNHACPLLRELGFEPLALGVPIETMTPAEVQFQPYLGIEQLRPLLAQHDPDIVLLPSAAAESFSYSFYESLFYAAHGVAVVSPYGHPPLVVQQHNCGVVMPSFDVEGLCQAVLQAHSQHAQLLNNKHNFLTALWHQESKRDVVDEWLAILWQ